MSTPYRLIEAAPALLDALRDNLALMEAEFDWALEGDVCDSESMCVQCRSAGCIRDKIDRTRAAIAKATGEQP